MKSLTFLVSLSLAYMVGCSANPQIHVASTLEELPEINRLRYFREINIGNVRDQYNLTGRDVRVTVMGEIVDPSHQDINKRINKQYNVFSRKGKAIVGHDNAAYMNDFMKHGYGHGTHIAGTIAAECDGIGIQGVACKSTVDVYDLGLYLSDDEQNEQMPVEGWGDSNEYERIFDSFSYALRHIVQKRESRIVTGSFNIEAPVIRYVQSGDRPSIDDLIIPFMDGRVNDIGDFTRLVAQPIDSLEMTYAEKMLEKFDDDPSVMGLSTIYLSQQWENLTKAVSAYQKTDGVYLATESNYIFDRTSVMNAMPTLSSRVDEDLWLSVVMVVPDKIDDFFKEVAKNTWTADEIYERIQERGYSTMINSCGTVARNYCIVVPSYVVLSTITERVNSEDSPILLVDDRTYTSMTGHSMGAPMVAATLALMEEHNINGNMGYTMKDLVRILKKNANRSFKGYDFKKHGQGMLDVQSAINAM